MGKVKEYKGKKYLMNDDYVLDELLGKIKEIIGIEELDDNKIIIDTDHKVSGDITF